MQRVGKVDITCLLENGSQRLHQNKEFVSRDKSELMFEHNFMCFSWLLDFILLCLHAQQLGAISPKPLCLAVVIRMCKIFLLQNKCRVANVCKNKCPAVDLSNFLSHNKCRVDNVRKNRYPAVDLATFYRKISAACVLILPGI